MSSSSLDTVVIFERNTVKVRRRLADGFVNVSDLWKSEGSPSTLRPDKWVVQQENQDFLKAVNAHIGCPPWRIVKGGLQQGTFASPEVAARYAMTLSLECHDWLCEVLDYDPMGGVKAKKRPIFLGELELEVFQLPSGEYRLSQTQVAEAIGKDESSFRKFLESESPEALPYKGFRSGKLPVEGNNKPINPIPVDLVIAYWTKESHAGNSTAIRLLAASAREAIERRADKAFGVYRSEGDYNHQFSDVFDKLVAFLPECSQLVNVASEITLMVLAEQDALKRLKKKYPSEVFKISKAEFIQDFVLLGAETDDWHFTHEKGISYPLGSATQTGYPDLITQPFEAIFDGQKKRVVLLIQGKEGIVDDNDIKDCVHLREYKELVKREHQADYVALFFVSPYGVTDYGARYLKDRPGLRDSVGVLTVKQLANFLIEKALQNKKDNLRVGKLKNRFKHLTDYKTLDELTEFASVSSASMRVTDTRQLQLCLFS